MATKAAAAPAVPVAVNVTGLPVNPATVAATVLAPAVVPSVHEVNAAKPDPSDVTVLPLAGTVEPPPLATVKVTRTPLTGFPFTSRTTTRGGVVTDAPTVAV